MITSMVYTHVIQSFLCFFNNILVCFIFILDDEAIRLFEVLKKRYSKKKMDHKRACVSSQETFLTKKTQSELEKYNFMKWMEPFIRFRTTKLITDVSPEQNVTNDNNHMLQMRRVDEQSSRSIDDYQHRDHHSNRKRSYDIAHSGAGSGYQEVTHKVHYDDKRISHPKPPVSAVRNSFPKNTMRNVERLPPLPALHSSEDTRYNTEIQNQSHQLDNRRENEEKLTMIRHSDSQLVHQSSRDDINHHHASASPTPTEESHKSIIEEGNGSSSSHHETKPIAYHTKVLRDEDELFSALIVSEMKNLDEKRRYQVKHKISNVLFDALMEQCEESKQGLIGKDISDTKK